MPQIFDPALGDCFRCLIQGCDLCNLSENVIGFLLHILWSSSIDDDKEVPKKHWQLELVEGITAYNSIRISKKHAHATQSETSTSPFGYSNGICGSSVGSWKLSFKQKSSYMCTKARKCLLRFSNAFDRAFFQPNITPRNKPAEKYTTFIPPWFYQGATFKIPSAFRVTWLLAVREILDLDLMNLPDPFPLPNKQTIVP